VWLLRPRARECAEFGAFAWAVIVIPSAMGLCIVGVDALKVGAAIGGLYAAPFVAGGLLVRWCGLAPVRVQRAGACAGCGYDLRGLQGAEVRCPECGRVR
jgi:hypothetical protein